MHIPDGILPLPITLGGYAVSSAAAWYCVHKIRQRGDPRDHIPKAALLTAAFFATSLIHIPVPPSCVHLMLGGLLGVVMGYFVFPAILVVLFFQAMMFGHGGLTTLGVNGIIIGLPALLSLTIFRLSVRKVMADKKRMALLGFTAGALATAMSAFLLVLLLYSTIPAHFDATAERSAIATLGLAHIPVAVIEGLVTAMMTLFLQKNKPQLLEGL